jgi:hypothetical protein
LTDRQEVIQVWPARRQPHDHSASARDDFGSDLDEPRPPRAGESFTQWIAFTPNVEKPPAMGHVDCAGWQLDR